jgi:hypothetical protein
VIRTSLPGGRNRAPGRARWRFRESQNLELANEEAKGVQLTPPGLPVLAGEAAEFMSKDCVAVREGVEWRVR